MNKKTASEAFKAFKSSEVMTHGWHLQTKSYAQHMALGGYYECLLGLNDAFVEAWQGRFGPRIQPPATINILAIDDMTGHFNDMGEYLDMLIKDTNEYVDIQDTLIDIRNLVNKTTYLLTLK